jgi:hypothetical protein
VALDNFQGIANASLKVAFEHAAPKLASRPDVKELLGTRDLHDYVRAFVDAVPFLKNASFKEENEYRIVALPTRSKALVEEIGDKRSWKEVHFREGAGGAMLPYIKLFEKPGVRSAMMKIIVGPHRDQENQLLAAKFLLEKNQLDIPVVCSATTFRS